MSSLKPPFDPELAVVLSYIPPADTTIDKHEGVLLARKATAAQSTVDVVKKDTDLTHEDITIPGPGGDIILAVIRRKNSAGGSRPGIYYIHGGGMTIGTRFFCLEPMFQQVKEFDAVLISVEYRLAPENPDPAPVEDCYAGLQWVAENAAKLGINPEKIMVEGGSAGGGLAAGIALMARDRGGPKLCAQLLIYPMLDDRVKSTSNQQFMTEGSFTGAENMISWDLLRPGERGEEELSIYAAPARATDLKGLPPTYIEVGACEPFRDEDVAYASKLWDHGVSTELHVWSGAFHGYDLWAPQAKVSQDAFAARLGWLKRIFD